MATITPSKLENRKTPVKLYTMQLNQRLVDNFQHTKLDSDFSIFKKTRAEKEIFRNFRVKDCVLEILKPNLKSYMITDQETSRIYKRAAKAMVKQRFDEAEKLINELEVRLRAPFRPGEILKSQIVDLKYNIIANANKRH